MVVSDAFLNKIKSQVLDKNNLRED